MRKLSKRQYRLLRVLHQQGLSLRQEMNSAIWTIGPQWSLFRERFRICIKTKEVSDLESIGLLRIVDRMFSGKSVYALAKEA
jgi:hypothetical protein